MKPKEQKTEIIYRIFNRKSNTLCGSYSRSYCEEYDFKDISEARNANCHGIFKDRSQYKIAKYKMTYELIKDDVDE